MAKIWKAWIIGSAVCSIGFTLWFAKRDWKKVVKADRPGITIEQIDAIMAAHAAQCNTHDICEAYPNVHLGWKLNKELEE